MRCCGDPSDCSRPCEARGPEPTFRVIDELHVWPSDEAKERYERLKGSLGNGRIHIGVDVAAPGSFTFWTDAAYPAQHSDDRIRAVLGDADWPGEKP